MSWVGERWELREGDELIGTFTIDEQDFPWLSGAFAPEPGFARWARLFAEEQALLDQVSFSDSAEDWERWETLYTRISSVLTVVAPSTPVVDYLLHIDDGRAHLRWTDTP